jgi:CubicO group peptidase (beta-lactamase class C family)
MTGRATLLLALATTVVATAQPTDPVVVQGDVASRIDAYLTRLTPFGWSGAVLVARDGTIVLHKGYGLANRASRTAWTPDTVGNIGSITKQFTAAAILKLEAMGRLKVTDTMAAHLPGVPADKAGITLHQLLTHTAGFPGDLGGSDDEPIGRDELVARVLAAPLARAPGQGFDYSNEGYSLLAAIVERVSGTGYEAFLQERLFTPAGMTRTGYLLPRFDDARLARGYRADGSDWGLVYRRRWREDGPGWYLRGNGGLQSTTGDLYKWHLALESDAVLPAAQRAAFAAPHVQTPGGDRYAYGWGVDATPRRTTVISHNGGNRIFFADFRRYVDERTVIVVLGNTPVIPATWVGAQRIEPLIFDPASVALPPAVVEVSAATRSALAGTYTVAAGPLVTIATTATGLRADSADPVLRGALHGLAAADGRFAELASRTAAIVAASAKGDFQPIVDAYGGRPALAQAEAGQGREWLAWRAEFGDVAGFDLLGVTLTQGDPTVVVQLRFARGTMIARYPWGPRRLLGFITERALPDAEFLSESATSYVLFDHRRRAPVRLTFAPDGRLRIVGDATDVTAVRVAATPRPGTTPR